MLIFKDSDRESVLSYFEVNAESRKDLLLKSKDDLALNSNLIDTPTRLINHSNDFLPQKKKINPAKLANKEEVRHKKIKTFQDLEQFSDVEKSQASTARKQEEDKRDMLFKIVSHNDIAKLKIDIQKQIYRR